MQRRDQRVTPGSWEATQWPSRRPVEYSSSLTAPLGSGSACLDNAALHSSGSTDVRIEQKRKPNLYAVVKMANRRAGFNLIHINVNKMRLQMSENRFPKSHIFHIISVKYSTKMFM